MPIDESLSFRAANLAILKVADRRPRAEDPAGDFLVTAATDAGHHVVARIRAPSEKAAIIEHVSVWANDPQIDCVIVLGGTGFAPSDVTPEALAQVWDREIPGFGELFRMISYRSVGSSAIQSRACAGLAGKVCLFGIPSSPGGVRDAWESLIATQLDSRHRPCNLIEHLNCACRG